MRNEGSGSEAIRSYVSPQAIGLIVPAYLLACGMATLVYGSLSDQLGRLSVIFSALASFVILTGLTVFARSSPIYRGSDS
jgi:MFS family permease